MRYHHRVYAKLKPTAMLSIVIPIHNEEPSILPLYDRLTAVLESHPKAVRNHLRG